jgi:GABA(A) receptor-associated protein
MNNFKNKHTFDRRVKESQRILEKYPDRFPIIIEKHRKCDFDIDKNKYLVPKDLTVGQLIFVIRRRIKLKQESAIFLFCNDIMPPTSMLISTLYENQKDPDGFLYIQYSGENSFG